MALNNKKQWKLQKSKKNKKIKAVDPFYRGERKNIHEKKCSNLAPKGEQDQFPGKLKELMRLKDQLKKGGKRKRNEESVKPKIGTNNKEKSKEKYIPVPSAKNQAKKSKQTPQSKNDEDSSDEKPLYVPVKQRKNESDVAYIQRTNREVNLVFEKSNLFDKYDISYTDMASGKMVKKYGMNEKKKKFLREKAKQRKEKKIEHKSRNDTGFEHLKDDVDFGEVVMSPPAIMAKPRKADSSTSKPGCKSLLLKDIIEKNSEPKPTPKSTPKPTPKKANTKGLNKTVKMKHLSLAKQTMLTEERDRVVKLYREMKKNRVKDRE